MAQIILAPIGAPDSEGVKPTGCFSLQSNFCNSSRTSCARRSEMTQFYAFAVRRCALRVRQWVNAFSGADGVRPKFLAYTIWWKKVLSFSTCESQVPGIVSFTREIFLSNFESNSSRKYVIIVLSPYRCYLTHNQSHKTVTVTVGLILYRGSN